MVYCWLFCVLVFYYFGCFDVVLWIEAEENDKELAGGGDSIGLPFCGFKGFNRKKRMKIYNNWTASNTISPLRSKFIEWSLVAVTGIWIKFWRNDMEKISWKFWTEQRDNVIMGTDFYLCFVQFLVGCLGCGKDGNVSCLMFLFSKGISEDFWMKSCFQITFSCQSIHVQFTY